jgi:hypothetical protein
MRNERQLADKVALGHNVAFAVANGGLACREAKLGGDLFILGLSIEQAISRIRA